LFDAGIELAVEPAQKCALGLRFLLEGFRGERAFADAALALSRWLLSRGLEREAKAFFASLAKENVEVPRHWIAGLDGPRIGGIGLTERVPAKDPNRLPRELFTSGVLLRRQQSVWVRVGIPADVERYARAVEIAKSIALPGVVPVAVHGLTEQGEPYLAVERHGRGANEVILSKAGLRKPAALAICGEAVAILGALALAGVKLPDARFRRFAIDEQGRLWLRDLVDAERAPDAARANALLAGELCLDVLGRADRVVVSTDVSAAMRDAEDCVAIARALETIE
jgi:hypothetical protein